MGIAVGRFYFKDAFTDLKVSLNVLEDFLRQMKDEATSLAEGYERLEQILAGAA